MGGTPEGGTSQVLPPDPILYDLDTVHAPETYSVFPDTLL